MLYWGEGNKTRDVGISNSEPGLIKYMMRWFREVCHVPESQFRVQLHFHSGQDEAQMKQFWAGITGISISQFGKSFIKSEGTGHRKNVLYNGTIKITICDVRLLRKILGWIEYFGIVDVLA